MAAHAALCTEAEEKAKAHGFLDRVANTSAVYPDPLGETLLNMRERVSGVCSCCCCVLVVVVVVFFFLSFLFSYFDD